MSSMRGWCHECSPRAGKDVPLAGEMSQVYHKRVQSFRCVQASMTAQAGRAVGFRIANAGTYVK